jgi:hypothetical protein
VGSSGWVTVQPLWCFGMSATYNGSVLKPPFKPGDGAVDWNRPIFHVRLGDRLLFSRDEYDLPNDNWCVVVISEISQMSFLCDRYGRDHGGRHIVANHSNDQKHPWLNRELTAETPVDPNDINPYLKYARGEFDTGKSSRPYQHYSDLDPLIRGREVRSMIYDEYEDSFRVKDRGESSPKIPIEPKKDPNEDLPGWGTF